MGEDDGRLFMVMELLQGETLNDYLKRVVKLPLERSLDMMMQVCEGLAVAHAHGIVHRDIKPGNMFVLKDGGVKILDFGVARLAEFQHDRERLHRRHAGFHVARAGARPRHRPAVRHLLRRGGLLLHALGPEAVRGAGPARRCSTRSATRTRCRSTAEEAPAGLWQILTKALAKSTTDRYRDMGALLVRSGQLRAGLRPRVAGPGDVGPERGRKSCTKLVGERLERADRLGLVTDASDSPFSDALLDRYPVLEERGADALGVVPFRRGTLVEIRDDIATRRSR